MDAKDAVARAKAYVVDLFSSDGQGVFDIRLEEIERDVRADEWVITLGFLRPKALPSTSAASGLASALAALENQSRAYRVVRLREPDGEVLSVKKRDRSADAA